MQIFAHQKLNVLAHAERGKQRPLLKQNAPMALNLAPFLIGRLVQPDAQHLDRSAPSWHQSKDGAQQDRFSCARTADDAQNLASPDIER